MPFACPECGRNKSLAIIVAMEIPPDSRSDDITLQVVECQPCGFSAVAVYEESRRGALGSEAVDHSGYRVGKVDVSELKAVIEMCPQPHNADCGCAAHLKLGTQDKTGRWNGLSKMVQHGIFEMVYTPDAPAQ